MLRRRRSSQSETLQSRLMKFAKEARQKASRLPPGPEQEDLLRKARRAETAFGRLAQFAGIAAARSVIRELRHAEYRVHQRRNRPHAEPGSSGP